MLNVYLIQMDSSSGDKIKNFETARRLLRAAAPKRDSLIILPEMFATGYLPHDISLAAENFKTSESGPTSAFLSGIANETTCFVMGGGVSLSGNQQKPTNHTSVYAPEIYTEFASYDKVNLFFPEKESFSTGKDITLFRIKEWNIAPFICYDLRFPELFREAVRAGANLITVQASWPAKRHLHWETLLRARAIENQVYIVAVNSVTSIRTSFTARDNADLSLAQHDETSKENAQTSYGRDNADLEGHQGENANAGCSLIFSPQGYILAQGSENTETVISANLDLDEEIRYRKSFPVLEDIFLRQKKNE